MQKVWEGVEMKYQTGIQKTILEIIKQSKEAELKYITKKQITIEALRAMPNLKDHQNKIGQALYQLQRKSKFRRPRIKKYYDKEGMQLGWTLVQDEWFRS